MGWGDRMKKAFVRLVAVAALAASAGWASVGGAAPGPDPDANGDLHSNCHTGSKFLGAGGEDRFKLHRTLRCGAGDAACSARTAGSARPGSCTVGCGSGNGCAEGHRVTLQRLSVDVPPAE